MIPCLLTRSGIEACLPNQGRRVMISLETTYRRSERVEQASVVHRQTERDRDR